MGQQWDEEVHCCPIPYQTAVMAFIDSPGLV